LRACGYDAECDEVECKMKDATMLDEEGDETRPDPATRQRFRYDD
jgi:hypothetical protein